ncbi:zinc ABC transporter substrate-binding protein [Nitrosopumilus sp. b1]|uniref:metal ABC transporter solute-binding protein, Zn/Mn family n=1 Tax=Nitrosopumilus sp. b1 TaxID=2109907 RepID=UPI0015F636CE|nr:zinc ABC transporter substrate-binding protein [Nitrosopumilus sp. b1]
MKKNISYAIGGITVAAIVIAVISLMSLTGNDIEGNTSQTGNVIQEDKITVYASFYPYYEFTKNVAGDKANVKQYLPAGIEAHDWEPRAGEIQSLKNADVFVYNGLGMEPYVDKIINSGEFGHVVFVKASDGVNLLKPEEHEEHGHAEEFLEEIAEVIEEFEEGHMTESQTLEAIEDILHEHEGDGHEHGTGVIEEIEKLLHDIEDGHINGPDGIEEIHHLVSGEDIHDEEHEKEDKHGHDHSFEHDPHIWLDPILVKHQVNNIKNALAEADPENANYYEQNAIAYNAKLDAFDAKVRSEIANCKKDTFVPFHNAFTYFGERYGLTVFAIGGVAPDVEASASEIAEFVDFVHDNDIKVIFAEELVDPRLAEVIADEAGAQVMIFSPIEALTPQEISKGVTFLDKMEQNLDVLKVALECQ